MADLEELRIALRTSAELAGATQVRDALRVVRSEAQQTQAVLNLRLLASVTQPVKRELTKDVPAIPKATQVVERELAPGDPARAIAPAKQVVTRELAGTLPRPVQTSQDVVRTVARDVPPIPTTTQAVDRRITKDVDRPASTTQDVERRVDQDVPAVPPAEQVVTRILSKDVTPLPQQLTQNVQRTVTREVGPPVTTTQNVVRSVSRDVGSPPSTVQQVARSLSNELPAPEPARQSVSRDLQVGTLPAVPGTTQAVRRELTAGALPPPERATQPIVRDVVRDAPRPTTATQAVQRQVVRDPPAPRPVTQTVERRATDVTPATVPPIVLHTVADTAGATLTRDALRQVRQEAQVTQQALTAQQQLANAIIRQSVSQGGVTASNLQSLRDQIQKQVGAAPTLSGTDLGVAGATRATTAVQQHTQALRGAAQATQQHAIVASGAARVQGDLSKGFDFSAASILRFGGSLLGLNVGLSVASSAGQAIKASVIDAVQAQAEAQRTARATAAAYGEEAAQFTRFAAALSTQTGFTSQSILEAALSARTLSANYGLSIEQTQRLIAVSADLARVRGIGVAEAFERVQSAIRGEAEASEFLGLTLNATFIKNNALNGSVRDTFETMTDAQKAQIIYAELLRQSANFSGIAAKATNELDGAMIRAETSGQTLSVTFGKLIEGPTIGALDLYTDKVRGLTRALEDAQKGRAVSLIPPREALLAMLPIPVAGTLLAPALAALLAIQAANPPKPAGLGQSDDTAFQKELDDTRAHVAASIPVIQKYGETFNIVNETLKRTHRSLSDVAKDIDDLQGRASTLSTIAGALSPQDTGTQAQVQALQDLQTIDARINAQRAAAAIEQERQREREATKITDPRDTAGANAARERNRLLDELLPKEIAVAEARRQQAEVSAAITAAQGAETTAVLQVLDKRQEVARLERDIADSVDRGLQLRQEETRLLAQQSALRPNNAVDDTQAQIQRDKLLLNVKGQDVETRRAARAEIRDLSRNVLPGQELDAFDANRQVTKAQRAENATSIDTQLRQNPIQRQIAALQLSAVAGERTVLALQQMNERLSLLGQVAAAITAAAEKKVQVVLSGDLNIAGFNGSGAMDPDTARAIAEQAGALAEARIFGQLTEGNAQAQLPPAIPQSGVRR